MTSSLRTGLAASLTGAGRYFPGGVRALDDVSLDIEQGEYLAVTGRSGSGKSTLLNVLGLLDRPSAGQYHLDGVDTSVLSEKQRAVLRATALGFVFQSFHLLPYRSVLENVMLGQLYLGAARGARQERADELLGWLGLGHRRDFPPSVLSGGERQRVAIARALAVQPRLLLCDEPTGNLDSQTSADVMNLFDSLHESGLTVVMVTHDPVVSRRAARRIALSDGRIVEDDRPVGP